jgi:predicted MPP superfamily phosphohydrolase
LPICRIRFIFNYAYDNWDIDLVVSGHTHGGLIRIPFKGGLYAPMQGFFPDYDEGWFRLGDHMQIVISAGMGRV